MSLSDDLREAKELTSERLWWLTKWERGGWSIGDPMRMSVKKWRAHTAALVKSGHLESDRPDDPDNAMFRITDAGRRAIAAAESTK